MKSLFSSKSIIEVANRCINDKKNDIFFNLTILLNLFTFLNEIAIYVYIFYITKLIIYIYIQIKN